MNEWIKKNRDTILVVAGATIATAAVAGVSVAVTNRTNTRLNGLYTMQMAQIAHESGDGILDTIIAHQDKLKSIQVVK
jgi:hypothetical protein